MNTGERDWSLEIPLENAGPRVHLVIGPVGAGKTTFVRELALARRAVALNLDDWMATLFSADRPEHDVMVWYRSRTSRCIAQIWKTAQAVLGSGRDVVLEIGLIQRAQRQHFYERVGSWDSRMVVYVVDAPREIRRSRVTLRNEERGGTFSMVVPEDIFELASDLWEPPNGVECQERTVRYVQQHQTGGNATDLNYSLHTSEPHK